MNALTPREVARAAQLPVCRACTAVLGSEDVAAFGGHRPRARWCERCVAILAALERDPAIAVLFSNARAEHRRRHGLSPVPAATVARYHRNLGVLCGPRAYRPAAGLETARALAVAVAWLEIVLEGADR